MATRKNSTRTNNSPKATSNTNHTSENTDPLEKFFVSQLKDIYYAEKKLENAIPEMIKACTTEELEDAFEYHLQQTQRHVKRLEKVFKLIGKKPEGDKCEAMDGLVAEAKEIIKDTKEGSLTRDAALIIAAQKVEHYEIATYGGLVELALTMDLHRAAEILERTLDEEEQTDRRLTDIAERYINVRAEQEESYSWAREEEGVEEQSV